VHDLPSMRGGRPVPFERLRWEEGIACPHCGSIASHYFLKPLSDEGRKTRTGAVSHRRVWKCRDRRKLFSVLTGTIFHGTKIPVRTWLMVVFEVCASKNGVAAKEIERKYDVPQDRMVHGPPNPRGDEAGTTGRTVVRHCYRRRDLGGRQAREHARGQAPTLGVP
jgi:hypothetical protein